MGGRRVLVIEDDDAVRLALEVFLGAEDEVGSVSTAADGNEGIAAARRIGPDVIVTDSNMPGLAGEELGRALRESCPSATIISFSGLLHDAPWADHRIQKGGPDTFDALASAVSASTPPPAPAPEPPRVTRVEVHDLRNLLTPVAGYAGMLESDSRQMDPDRISEIARRIVEAVERLDEKLDTL